MELQTLQIVGIVMGFVTFILSGFSIIPQIISLRKARNTSGISLIALSILCFDNVLWLIWAFGFYVNSMLMYTETMTRLYQVSLIILCVSYTFGSVLVSYTLVIKIKHLVRCKQLKVNELQLAKILLTKDKNKYFINKKWNNTKRYFLPILFIVLVTLISFGIGAILYFFAYIQPVKGEQEWVWVIVFSFLSAGIWEISCWPQLYKAIKWKDVTGISLFWCVFSAVNCIVTFGYDLILSYLKGGFNWDVLFVLIFSAIIPNVGVMIVKLKNISKAKKKGMTELEYTKKVLIPLAKTKHQKKQKTV